MLYEKEKKILSYMAQKLHAVELKGKACLRPPRYAVPTFTVQRWKQERWVDAAH